ncbi:MAG: M23 family metallopeptidase [Pyrinomonadaceae bacterium]
MVRKITLFSSVLALALLLAVTGGSTVFAQKFSAVPVDIELPIAPTPINANGKIHLIYELHLTNYKSAELKLTRIEIFGDVRNAAPLASYEDSELTSRISRIGAAADTRDKRIIGGGMLAVVFLQITVNSQVDVPGTLHHRLFFRPQPTDTTADEKVVDSGYVTVLRKAPLVIAPPLRGEGWIALSALSNTNSHRRTLVVVNGQARIAQRFATDWTRIGPDGQAFRGDAAINSNWSPYGAEVLAVADAVVVDTHDGVPENDPTSDKKAVLITLDTVGGNYIILDLGHGYFAFYAHLQPKSLRFKIGDKVRRGQTLALLGNSGQADAPHLHFHVTDGNSPLGAEDVPYVFESFVMQGILSSKGLLVNGEGWKSAAGVKIDRRRMEVPIENAVVSFP